MTKDGSLKGILLPLTLMWLCHFAVDFMIGIWPVYKTMMQMDLATVGIMTSASVAIGEGAQLYFGSLSDSGYRKLVIVGGLLTTIAAVLYPYVYTFGLSAVFILLLVTCLGSGAFHPGASSLVGNLSKSKKGVLITTFASGGMIGLATSQIIFSKFYLFNEGSTAFLAIPTIILFGALLFVPVRESQHQGKRKGLNIEAFKVFFARKDLSWLYILQVANQAIYWAMVFVLPDVLLARGYEPWISFGGGHLALIMGCAIMMIPGGYLSDRYSPKKVIWWATVIGMVMYYLFLFIPEASNVQLLTTLFLIGASMGIVNPISVGFGTKLMPENPGLVSAILMGMAWAAAEAIGPSGAGVLTKCFQGDAPAKALAVMGFFFLASIYACMKLPAEVKSEVEMDIPLEKFGEI